MRIARGWKSWTGVLLITGNESERARNGIPIFIPFTVALQIRYVPVIALDDLGRRSSGGRGIYFYAKNTGLLGTDFVIM